MLLGKRNAFIVDERGVLDRRDSRANRILDAFGRMCVRFDTQPEIAGFLDGGAQFLGRKLDGFRIAAMGENGARGEDLDVIGTAVRELANLLPDFPRTVCLTVAQIPRQLDIRRQAGHRSGALADGDVSPRHIHARPDDDAACDCIAHGHIVERPVNADVAHRRKAGEQRDACVGDGRVRGFRGGPLQNLERFRVGKIGQMGVAINEPGKDGHCRQIDDLRAVRNGQVRADGVDFRAANDNDLVCEDAARLHVDELAGADGGDGRGRRGNRGCTGPGALGRASQRYEGQTKQGECYFLVHRRPLTGMTWSLDPAAACGLAARRSHDTIIRLFKKRERRSCCRHRMMSVRESKPARTITTAPTARPMPVGDIDNLPSPIRMTAPANPSTSPTTCLGRRRKSRSMAPKTTIITGHRYEIRLACAAGMLCVAKMWKPFDPESPIAQARAGIFARIGTPPLQDAP